MNKLQAVITEIKSSGDISLITLECKNELFSALIISNQEEYIQQGNMVWMVFKETELSIGKELKGKLSIRNRFSSRIISIHKGEILSEVIMDFHGEQIRSLITTTSCESLELIPGLEVEGLLKTNELLLMRYDK